jgi:hypothetical protein
MVERVYEFKRHHKYDAWIYPGENSEASLIEYQNFIESLSPGEQNQLITWTRSPSASQIALLVKLGGPKKLEWKIVEL